MKTLQSGNNKFEYTETCPPDYFVWSIGRHNFKFPCCIPLCRTKNDDYHVDADTLLYMKVKSERLALRIISESELGKVDAKSIQTIIDTAFDKSNHLMKSYADVSRQYYWLERNYPNSHLLDYAFRFANHYKEQILRHQEICRASPDHHTRFDYAVRSYVGNTPREVIETLKNRIVEGLYAFDDYGNKITPWNIYFGIDTRLWSERGDKCGGAYFHYLSALRPVYLPNGRRFRIDGLSNVCCKYKDNTLSDWYRE